MYEEDVPRAVGGLKIVALAVVMARQDPLFSKGFIVTLPPCFLQYV